MSKVHDYLANPRYKWFLKFDLKDAYWVILVYLEDRYYFIFTISGIGQIQPLCIPQGSISSGFSMTELMYITLGEIPATENFPGWPSTLATESEGELPKNAFYIDDIFAGITTFEEGYSYMKDVLFPRIEWAKLKLSFQKLELFIDEVTALGIVYRSGGKVLTKPERAEKIHDWPIPKNLIDVRAFLGAIGMTRRWVKNFTELKAPLTRLTGDIEWRWENQEQIAFQILKEKCSTAVEMYGWDFKSATRLYSDASKWGAGCAITQMRDLGEGKLTEVPILYDVFIFSKPQRNYGVYKCKLCSIIEFCRKYDYMFRNAFENTVFTDYKLLMHFLRSSYLDGIYARWACDLRDLSLNIVWIPGKRNPVADALSRTVFPDLNGDMPDLSEFGDLLSTDGESKWIWKDGKDGYEELLKKIGEPLWE
jgi:hypothetical protein